MRDSSGHTTVLVIPESLANWFTRLRVLCSLEGPWSREVVVCSTPGGSSSGIATVPSASMTVFNMGDGVSEADLAKVGCTFKRTPLTVIAPVYVEIGSDSASF